MVDKYYLDPSNFDPRLFGISLQTQHMIPGRYSEKKTPAMLLDKDVKFYKYQQLSTWGPVFFANHWYFIIFFIFFINSVLQKKKNYNFKINHIVGLIFFHGTIKSLQMKTSSLSFQI